MKLKYIVNIDLNDKQARSIQVRDNAKAFYNKLGGSFECIAVGNGYKKPFRNFSFNNMCESSKLRKVLFHIFSIKYIYGADVVYSRNLTVLLISAIFRKRVVWEMHSGVAGIINQIILHIIKRKVKIISISESQIAPISHNFNINISKFCVARSSIYFDNYQISETKKDLKKLMDLPLDKFIIMHTGSLYEGRGAELFGIILKEFPNVFFVQVGGNELNSTYWKEEYKNYKNIRFVSHQNNKDLVRYQMSADLLFLPMTQSNPIWWCTSPMKVIEYMASGTPILASNPGAIGEILNCNNAIIFDEKKESSLIDSVSYCIDNYEYISSLSDIGRNEARDLYGYSARIDSILNFIET
jgi:glycosyltransferase involved in cell wall biosynthesis